MRRFLSLLVLAGLPCLLTPVRAQAVNVRVVVEDQLGQEIAGSQVRIGSAPWTFTGGTVAIEPGEHVTTIAPVLIPGRRIDLFRTETVTVTSSTTELRLQWIRALVRLDVKDQFGTTIPNSWVTIASADVHPYPAGTIVPIPITDDAVYPTIYGQPAGGYTMAIVPSLPQRDRVVELARDEFGVEVTASTTELAFEWITSQVALHLRDQFGVAIPNSYLTLVGANLWSEANGGSVTLPITDEAVYPTLRGPHRDGYRVRLVPGIAGTTRAVEVYRDEAGCEVGSSTTALGFEWITSAVTMRLRDQFAAEIPLSQIVLQGPNQWSVPTGGVVTLPITDEGVYPGLFGVDAVGYRVALWPGIPGADRMAHLFRLQAGNEVAATTTELVFEWMTTPVTLRVQDQSGAEIPGSWVTIDWILPSLMSVPTGSVVTLPITDNVVYPTIAGGSAADGFDLRAHPALGWAHRTPTLASNLARATNREIGLTTTLVAVEWHVVQCMPALRLAGGPEVPGTIYFGYPHNTEATGSTVRLPITENAVYPDLVGQASNGYTITIGPAAVAPLTGTFEFEVLQSGAFEPATFVIGGETYSLFCRTNVPPTVDAGPNRSILSSEVATTILVASVVDPDGPQVTYRWLSGTDVLFGPALVGSNGLVSLALATGPNLSIGTHELVLEATDGIEVAADRMILSIGNSPPVPVAFGAGTYQAGTDGVVLGGTVGDFDADQVVWSWWNGPHLLGSGALAALPGGAPTPLASLALTTGVGGDLAVGSHVLQLRVWDGMSAPVVRDVHVAVVDTAAPRLAPVADRTILWPPNHTMTPVTIAAHAVDAAGGPVILTASVQSTEDAYKNGSGHTIPDFSIEGVDSVTGHVHLLLRSERAGKGSGRTYTVTITATDAAGNRSTAAVQVVAPHDRG